MDHFVPTIKGIALYIFLLCLKHCPVFDLRAVWLLSCTVRRALNELLVVGPSSKKQFWLLTNWLHGGIGIDSIFYYGKLVYQDINLRSYFGSIRPPTSEKLTFGFRLGRCIIIHFQKRTFINGIYFFPKEPFPNEPKEKGSSSTETTQEARRPGRSTMQFRTRATEQYKRERSSIIFFFFNHR